MIFNSLSQKKTKRYTPDMIFDDRCGTILTLVEREHRMHLHAYCVKVSPLRISKQSSSIRTNDVPLSVECSVHLILSIGNYDSARKCI